MGTGAERRRLRRLEEEALRDLQSTCDLAEDAFLYRLRRSREGRVISIDLEDRINICALPNSIGQLKALTYLDLFHCIGLTTLPEGFGGLTALETLILSHCIGLAALPDTIGELKSLTKLHLNDCESLVALPDSIDGLAALETLILFGCQKLVALPKAIGDLKALTVLCLGECSSLTELPDTIGGLIALKELDLCRCPITALPAAIGELKSLTKLDLGGCSSLVALPDSIGELGALADLNLAGCSSLAALPAAILDRRRSIEKFMPHTTYDGRMNGYYFGTGPRGTGYYLDEGKPNLDIRGWEPPRSGSACFAELARPRVKAFYPERTDDSIDGMISRYYWENLSESKRAKLDDPHDGDAHGEILVSNLIKVMKMYRRRICDACGRGGEIEEDRFPVCWCGARRYCGEECQKADWDAGHSRTCASGYTWSATDLHWFRRFEEDRVLREQVVDDGHPSFLFDEGMVQLRQALIDRNPPPADRER